MSLLSIVASSSAFCLPASPPPNGSSIDSDWSTKNKKQPGFLRLISAWYGMVCLHFCWHHENYDSHMPEVTGWSPVPTLPGMQRRRVAARGPPTRRVSQRPSAASSDVTGARLHQFPGGMGAIAHAHRGREAADGRYSPLQGWDVQLQPHAARDLLASWGRGGVVEGVGRALLIQNSDDGGRHHGQTEHRTWNPLRRSQGSRRSLPTAPLPRESISRDDSRRWRNTAFPGHYFMQRARSCSDRRGRVAGGREGRPGGCSRAWDGSIIGCGPRQGQSPSCAACVNSAGSLPISKDGDLNPVTCPPGSSMRDA